jgi:hypothetical protein
MFTNERISNLSMTYGCMINCSGGCPTCSPEDHGLHEVINSYDAAAGIDTSGGIKLAPLGRSGVVAVNPIGARLALHEQFLAQGGNASAPYRIKQAETEAWLASARSRPRYYHWLGYDACCACGCGEHRRT